jgi:hypothetical protein
MSLSFVSRRLWTLVTLSLFAATAAPALRAQDSCPCPPGTAGATTSEQSALAAAAQAAKTSRAGKAKKVFTDEDMEVRKGPFARLNLQGPDNGDQILESMVDYRKKHSAEESATAIREWYNEHDAILAAAIEEGQQLKNLRNANMSNGYEMCQEGGDYERCEKRRRSEVRGAMYDRNKILEDGLLTARLQQTFMRIRNGLNTRGGNYPWFKIRNANGVGNF